MNWTSTGLRGRGLSLIELLIALAVLSITLMLSAPPMQRLVHQNQLRGEASRLVSAINLARSEAILRNSPVSLCPSPRGFDGSSHCSGEYAQGWVVFVNVDRDGQVDDGVDHIIRSFAPAPEGYTLTNRAGTRPVTGAITYLPDGSSRRNRTLLLCAPLARELESWSIVLNMVGRARVERGVGTCPVAST